MADHVLGHVLHVVEALGGEHVAVEFRVQISRVVGRPQRKAEIVHGEDVFEQFGVVQVAYAAGLARIVERVRQRVGARVEVVIVDGFVDAHAPQDDRGVVPVAPDHAGDIIHGRILPRLIADVLPPRNLFEHQQARLVAGVQKGGRLRVVRGAHNVALQFLAQHQGVARLHPRRHGAAGVGERLVAVQAAQLHVLAVEIKTGETRFPEPDPRAVSVAVVEPRSHLVELGPAEVPQLDITEVLDGDIVVLGGRVHRRRGGLHHAIPVAKLGRDDERLIHRPVEIAAHHHGAIA